jgi:hypothetical protein
MTNKRTVPFDKFPEHERGDFEKACRQIGKDPDQFNVWAEESDRDGLIPAQRAVTVQELDAIGKKQPYIHGIGRDWIKQFARDFGPRGPT